MRHALIIVFCLVAAEPGSAFAQTPPTKTPPDNQVDTGVARNGVIRPDPDSTPDLSVKPPNVDPKITIVPPGTDIKLVPK